LIHRIITTIATMSGTLAVCSLGYHVLCLYSAARFLNERKAAGEGARPTPSTPSAPPVSILKPLKGIDPEMYESFRSHCLQDYPEYEIIFGISDAADPARELVDRLQQEFPRLAIHLMICPKTLGSNIKVSNLAQMLPRAKYENILVNDSDIRVQPDYLRQVIAPLADSRIGLVTCLYRGIASPTLGSRMEAIGISTDFAAGVLAARQLEGGISFGLGSTLAFRRRDLAAIGGFEAIVDYLADDYEIGRRMREHGLTVKLSEAIVETFLPAYRLRQFVEHQLRWGRAVRDSRRWGYLGLVLTFGLPWAVAALVLSGGVLWGWALLAAVMGMRVAVALVVGWSVLRDRQVVRLLALLPLRDFIALLVWIASLVGDTVIWRGETFTLKDGRLGRVDS
jgi:ceramide glucosyltransferase